MFTLNNRFFRHQACYSLLPAKPGELADRVISLVNIRSLVGDFNWLAGGGVGGIDRPTHSECFLASTVEAFTPLSLFSMASIVADEDVFLQFNEESKKQYSRIWSQFRDFVPEHDFELAPPAEDSFTLFFNFLRHCVLCSGAGHFIANMLYSMHV